MNGLLGAALLAIAFVMGSPDPARAQSERRIEPVVDAIVQPLLREKHIPGLIVGVSQGGLRSYFPYTGATDTDASPASIGADTVLEIGSITKVLTALLFAEAVIDGRMRSDDSIQLWMPEGMRLLPRTRQVTPLQLASFQSGMPHLPDNVPQGGVEARDIDHYSRDDFLSWVVHWSPGGDLPAPYGYSNASIGLLALLVGTATGHPWPDLMRSQIIDPLGMIDTALEPGPDQTRRMAQGHAEDGTPVPPWPLFAWSAASSLKSTAQDMLAFGEANLGRTGANGQPPPPSRTEAMRLAMHPIYRVEGAEFLQAMVWAVIPGDARAGTPEITVKSGNTDGFSTVLALAPQQDLAIFIGANQAKVDVRSLAIDIARTLP